MSSESILKSDLLDIVFQNRNKAYGAYTLRKEYPGRLYAALAFTFFVVLIFSLFNFIRFPESFKAPDTFPDPGPLVLREFIMQEPPRVAHHSTATTIKNGAPVIVKDIEASEVPETTELENKAIGTISQPGDATGEGPDAPPSSPGTTETTTGPALAEVKEEILTTADVMPEFPGGLEALRRFLSRNLRNPEEDMATGASVRAVARFVIDKEGNISGILFKEPVGPRFEQEVVRVLKKMPKWKPGVFRGRPASVYFVLPVVFQMQEE